MTNKKQTILEDADSQDTGRNPADDLALIRSLMEAGRRRAGIDGGHFVLWGAVLMAAFFAQYAAVLGYLPETIVGIWGPALLIGMVCEFFMHRNEPKRRGGPNIALVAYSSAWMTVGLGVMTYFIVSLATGTFSGRTISILSAGMIGAAFFVTARVTGVRWLMLPAAGWGLMLAYMAHTLVYDREMLLVMAIASGLLILLPGQLMKRLAAGEA